MSILHLFVFTLCVGFSFGQTAVGEGAICNVKKEGWLGKCRNIEHCDFFQQFYQNGHLTQEALNTIRPYRCGQGTQLVCCPTTRNEVPTTQRPRQRSSVPVTTRTPPVTPPPPPICDVPPLSSYEGIFPSPGACGNSSEIDNRIHGGQKTKLRAYPWTGLVEYSKPNNQIGVHCGGTLITNRYFLTAAHCIAGRPVPKNWKILTVRLGEWDTSTEIDCDDEAPTDCIGPAMSVPVEEIIVHEEYDGEAPNNPNDIALIRLKNKVPYSSTIRPVCLPLGQTFAQYNYIGKLMQIIGWGRTEDGHTSARKLMADVNVADLQSCKNKFQTQGITVLDHQMCAGGVQGTDSCNGDSGGGLFYDLNGLSYMIGIISFGTSPCGQRDWPGVYTRVDNFIDWIVRNIRS